MPGASFALRCAILRVLSRNGFNFSAVGDGSMQSMPRGASNQGVISSLLFNTPMRQIQLVMKPNF